VDERSDQLEAMLQPVLDGLAVQPGQTAVEQLAATRAQLGVLRGRQTVLLQNVKEGRRQERLAALAARPADASAGTTATASAGATAAKAAAKAAKEQARKEAADKRRADAAAAKEAKLKAREEAAAKKKADKEAAPAPKRSRARGSGQVKVGQAAATAPLDPGLEADLTADFAAALEPAPAANATADASASPTATADDSVGANATADASASPAAPADAAP
jgi:hypothetical protein